MSVEKRNSHARAVSNDELYHWKYIKREKQANGKWKYTYYRKTTPKSASATSTSVTKKKADGVPNGTVKKVKNFKYVKKEKINGKWRYFYDVETAVSDGKKKISSIFEKIGNKAINIANDKIEPVSNTVVEKGKKLVKTLYDNKTNMYDITSKNYNAKKKQISQLPEWKAIVARKDPEYVKKNDDGTTTYLIDDYIAKKKHPVLDVVDDVTSGRKVKINKITKNSVAAGLKDYVRSTVSLAATVASLGSKFLIEKFKTSQGSYDEDIKQVTTATNNGAKYIQQLLQAASSKVNKQEITNLTAKISEQDIADLMSTVSKRDIASKVNKQEIARLASTMVSSTTNATTSSSMNSDKITTAVEKMMKSASDDSHVESVKKALVGLSEEEIEAAYRIMLRQLGE